MSNTLLQPAAFLSMLYGGVCTGIAYDVFRFFRRLTHRRWLHVCCDVLFALAATLLAAGSLLVSTGGSLRLFLVLGYGLGIALQQWSLSYLFFHGFYRLRARMR